MALGNTRAEAIGNARRSDDFGCRQQRGQILILRQKDLVVANCQPPVISAELYLLGT